MEGSVVKTWVNREECTAVQLLCYASTSHSCAVYKFGLLPFVSYQTAHQLLTQTSVSFHLANRQTQRLVKCDRVFSVAVPALCVKQNSRLSKTLNTGQKQYMQLMR